MQPALSTALWRRFRATVPQAVCIQSVLISEVDGKPCREGGRKYQLFFLFCLKGRQT